MRRIPGYFVILPIVALLIGFQLFPSMLVAGAEKPGPGICPDGYRLVPAVERPRADDNRNGWICMGRVEKGGKTQVVFVDDRIRDERASRPGACPEDYRLVSAREHPQADANRNGWICMGRVERNGEKHVVFVDDRMRDERGERPGSCPDDFRIASARENPETDRNRNGWICKKIIENKGNPHANFVDDKV